MALQSSHLKRPIIVAVDGPAGSGKSSICAQVCRDLDWSYVNTGALYRVLALVLAERKVSHENSAELRSVLIEFSSKVKWQHKTGKIFIGEVDYTPLLGSVEAASGASKVAKIPQIREALLPIQRDLSLSAPIGVIVDGRDIGTVVFPDADVKIFMTASIEQRARRRLAQLISDGASSVTLSLADIMKTIGDRDLQDSQRETAPMTMASDSVMFDTSNMDIQESIVALKTLLKTRGLCP
ncbi:MAG: (d)CMP kinase [Proteobacteria bacterium]|nr:(d)CMP kinase [Pseudomonadota bacterium]